MLVHMQKGVILHFQKSAFLLRDFHVRVNGNTAISFHHLCKGKQLQFASHDNMYAEMGSTLKRKNLLLWEQILASGFQVALKFLKNPIFLGLPKIPKKKHSKRAKFLKRPLFFRIIPNFLSISRAYSVKNVPSNV